MVFVRLLNSYRREEFCFRLDSTRKKSPSEMMMIQGPIDEAKSSDRKGTNKNQRWSQKRPHTEDDNKKNDAKLNSSFSYQLGHCHKYYSQKWSEWRTDRFDVHEINYEQYEQIRISNNFIMFVRTISTLLSYRFEEVSVVGEHKADSEQQLAQIGRYSVRHGHTLQKKP